MKFYRPKFLIATLQEPQSEFRSKFGGLPWGLPLEKWRRCQVCHRRMSLLAQLKHDPPALDLGGPDNVLHLFQCQECFGFESGKGNAATIERVANLGDRLTPLPLGEDLRGIIAEPIGAMVGELWIDGWDEKDDGLDSTLAIELFDQKKWMDLPESVMHLMFESRWRTKMGGVPYWTGVAGPPGNPPPGFEFLFQLNDGIEFEGKPPGPDRVGGNMIVTHYDRVEQKIVSQEVRKPAPDKKKINAPWDICVDSAEGGIFYVGITNLGEGGTAYVFIDRHRDPPDAYWYWTK